MKLFFLFLFLILPTSMARDQSFSWIDIPKQPLAFHLGHEDSFLAPIDTLIDDYHRLDKSKKEHLNDRIDLLNSIFDELQVSLCSVPRNEKTKKVLLSLSRMAQKKSSYLCQLKTILDHKLDSYESMYNFYAHHSVDESRRQGLCLVNKILYASNLPSYWGLFWLEALDPCHRMLTPYYVQWQETGSKNHFFMWLETQEIPYYIFQIALFTDEERLQYQYKFSEKDGLLRDLKGEVATLNENVEYIYIITLKEEIFIAKGSASIRHFSLSGGSLLFCAGAIKVFGGQITYLDGESGHYQPTSYHIKQAIDVLISLGAKTDVDFFLRYYHQGKVIDTTLSQFLLIYEPYFSDPSDAYLPNFTLRGTYN